MKASGVYYNLTDASFRTSGSAAFYPVVVGMSKKGSTTELIKVTSKNLDEVLGYDLSYSPEMLGLASLLELVSYVYFLRINVDPKVANAYIGSSGATSAINLKIPEALGAVEGLKAGFALPYAGNWGSYAVKVTSKTDESVTTYTVVFGELQDDGSYMVKATYSGEAGYFTSTKFAEFVFFGDISEFTADTWVTLNNGNNGTAPTSAAQLTNLSALNKKAVNFLATNGLQNQAVVNAILQKAESRLISAFCDIPALTTYDESFEYRKNLYASEYASVHARPDVQNVPGVGDVYVWPSINMLMIYAKMFSSYGNTYYPPAGHAYGAIAASNLLETDYSDYMDELKTNKINHQLVDNRGPCMWEQRTLYASESDLSYINTVCILRDLREQILEFMRNFNFRYTTGAQLLIIDSGLKSIFKKMYDGGFLSDYSIEVPSFEEAQKQGREVDIPMSCSVTQDGEVFNMNLTLKQYGA